MHECSSFAVEVPEPFQERAPRRKISPALLAAALALTAGFALALLCSA
jgi:hypothetical protein